MMVAEPQAEAAEIIPELEAKLDELILALEMCRRGGTGQARIENDLYVKQIGEEIAEVSNRMTALIGRPPIRF